MNAKIEKNYNDKDNCLEVIYKGYKFKVIQDEDPSDPRGDDNLGTMICFHRRYNLGDKHNFKSSEEVKEYIKETKSIALPLYLYDHSGISMSTSREYPFNCPWDSGQVGMLIVEAEKIKKEYKVKRITKRVIEKVVEVLRSEVKTYDQFLKGEVYGYNFEEGIDDSCWGFYGSEYCIENACEVVDYHIKTNMLPNWEEANKDIA